MSEPPAIYCTMVRRTAGFEALIGAELAHMYGAAEAELGVYVSDVPIPWGETAFGVAGGRQLAAAATLEELGAQLRALELRPSSFGIRLFRIPQTAKGGVAAKTVVGDSILCTAVDPLSTACPLGLIISPAGFRVFVRDDDGGDADWLRVERRPNNLPISIGVRLAKALLNLTVGRPCEADRFVVFDPFAGSGTIPLVAALSGHTALGSDIDRKAMKLAAGNATALGAIAAFCQEDARESTQRADCIISNPPYGTFSHISDGAIAAVLANLRGLAPRVTLVTSQDLRPALLAAGYTLDAIIEVEPERFKRFVFVARCHELNRSV